MSRADDFRAEMQRLEDSLDWQQYWDVIKNRIIDALARGTFAPEDREDFKRQIRELTGEQFRGWMDDIYDTFQESLYVVNNLYQDMGVNITRDMTDIRAIEQTNATRIGKFEDATIRRIADTLRPALLKGMEWQDVADELKKIDSKTQFYGDTLARTLVKGYGRYAKRIKADMAGIKYYEYVGPNRANTRPFCFALNGHHCSAGEIRLSKNGHGIPVKGYCGGYNCHHEWEPDPFFTDEDAAGRGDVKSREFKEGRRTVRFFGTDAQAQTYRERRDFLKQRAKRKRKK